LSVHLIFSTKDRHPWLSEDIRARLWAYQSRILQNLECHSITIGGAEDHVHVACNLTKKLAPAKVIELLKKDSSKFVKTLRTDLDAFHWQDGYGLFSVSPSHLEPLRQYILSQQEHHRKESFQEELLRVLKKYQLPRRTLPVGLRWFALAGREWSWGLVPGAGAPVYYGEGLSAWKKSSRASSRNVQTPAAGGRVPPACHRRFGRPRKRFGMAFPLPLKANHSLASPPSGVI